MDRLIALVALRWRLDVRAVTGERLRFAAAFVAVPGLMLISAAASFVMFAGVRFLDDTRPELTLSVLSTGATALGLVWSLSPLLAGMALTETHDLNRLLHFPIPLPTLVLSSLLANLLQSTVLALMPPLFFLGLAVAGSARALVPVVFGLGLTLALVVATGQLVGVALHALSRRRHLHDRMLFVGVVLGLMLSFLPLLLISGAVAPFGRLARELLVHDVFVLSPFAWGIRAAVHGGRGQALAFFGFAVAGALAVAAVVGLSTALVQRMYRGELDLGDASRGTSSGRSRVLLRGPVGALLEKDLRMVWRDPRQKAIVLSGLVAPLILLVFVWHGSSGQVGPLPLFLLASFAGLSTLGSNAFALERRGLALLLGFPVERFLLFVGKNVSALLLRVPAVLMIAAATALLAGFRFVPAVLVILWLTQLLAAAADNYLAVLFPVPVPAPGRNQDAPTSGSRGLGVAFVTMLVMLGALALSSPFAFLVWLPHLLGDHRLWLITLPLSLAGGVALYGMLTAGAAGLLARREPDLLARVLGEE